MSGMAKKRIPQPLSKGVAKVPVIMQMEALECGAACLAMVLAYYQKWIPLEQVRLDCGVSRDGSNMKNVFLAAQHYGLEVHGYRMEVEGLKRQVTFPCIIHWEFNHFVVLDGFRGNKAVINDPARGVIQLPMEQFDNGFTGLVLTFAPGEGFTPSGKKKSMVSYARQRLKGAAPAVAFVVLISLISYLFGVINPVMSRIFFDRLLNGKAPQWLYPFLGVMIALALFQIVVQWAQAVYNRKINGKMAIEGNASYMWKVLHLPMEFFSQRMVGDILQRKSTNASIAETLVSTVAPLALNTVMMVFYLAVMLRYSVLMTLVGIASLLLNLLTARYLSEKRVVLFQRRAQGAKDFLFNTRHLDLSESEQLCGLLLGEVLIISQYNYVFFEWRQLLNSHFYRKMLNAALLCALFRDGRTESFPVIVIIHTLVQRAHRCAGKHCCRGIGRAYAHRLGKRSYANVLTRVKSSLLFGMENGIKPLLLARYLYHSVVTKKSAYLTEYQGNGISGKGTLA